MSQDCIIHNNDLVLFVSVLLVLVLVFPLLDFIILRVTWFYKDNLFLPQGTERSGAHKVYARGSDSYFSRSISSYSTPSRPVHPMARTETTLIFANEDSRDAEDSHSKQRKKEDSIIYGISQHKHYAMTAAKVETASEPIRLTEESSKFRIAERRYERHTAVHIDPLPSIETPSWRELSARRRAERVLAADATGDTFANLTEETALPTLTRVTPVSVLPPVSLKPAVLPPLPTARTSHQSSEFLARLADRSILYQDNYDVAYIHSRIELIETPSLDSTPQITDKKLLSRPDNVRRKISKLGSPQPNSPSPK